MGGQGGTTKLSASYGLIADRKMDAYGVISLANEIIMMDYFNKAND